MHAPASAGPEVLEAMQRCLQAAGVQCSMDRGGYSIQGSYSPSAEQLAAAAAADGDDDGASGAEPASKRQRATGGGHTAWTLQLHLFMQHAGLFLLTASLHKSAPDGALAWFGGLMQQLQGALAARWKVQA